MKIFFSGIGGAGLGPLAQLSLDCGYEVVGSDIATSLITDELHKRGVEFSLVQNGEYLQAQHLKKPIDLYVFSSAVTSDNPEYQKALELGIPVTKRSGLINQILKQKNLKLFAVAGTHGKTTTTAMAVWLFKELGIPVSYSIGSNISFGPSAQYQAASEWFVYEADEFDRNFLDFYPEVSIITSLDYDHPDTYPTRKEYWGAFEKFMQQTKESVYLWKQNNDMLGTQTTQKNILVFDVAEAPVKNMISEIELPGVHNRSNAFLVISALTNIISKDSTQLLMHIKTFPGTQRRFEKINDNLYSDYAHHPAEIRATLQLANEIAKNIVVIYQPHQNLRQHQVISEYKTCFEGAEKVYWLPTYLSREPVGLSVLTQAELSRDIINTEVVISQLDDALFGDLKADLSAGKTVVAMGAGSVDAWMRDKFIK